MTRDIFQFLKNYSSDTLLVNRLIVSSYVRINKLISINNRLIKRYIINNDSRKEAQALTNFSELILKYEHDFLLENLIELFEFVISPSDKVVNGAVYTPSYIREHIVDNALKGKDTLANLTCADISCGCGGFLLDIAKWLRTKTGRRYHHIYKDNLFGIDITAYSIERAKILLTLNAIENGEDEKEFKFNFFVGNALDFIRSKVFPQVKTGFDAIMGNPPYVCSRNMDKESTRLLTNWSVTSSGHPDLYIPFFQIAIENLDTNGILGYITVNTFFKSINGRSLRKYFKEKELSLRIINFGGEQVFKARNTYTCICFIKKGTSTGFVEYALTKSNSIKSLRPDDFKKFEYDELNNHDGWNLVNTNQANEFVKKVESVGIPFKDKFVTRNGIATLKNNIYKFTPFKIDRSYYYLRNEEKEYKIEKAICRDVVNSNKLKNTKDINALKEKIIFPYTQQGKEVILISEDIFRKKYSNAYSYLLEYKKVLSKRDKGKGKYEAWYAYGRKQSLDINSYKLFFPHISERPSFVLCLEKDLLFYNGIAVISNDLEELKLLKRILESDVFFYYLKKTTKNYASGYISLSKNYIKNFGIHKFTDGEKSELIATSDLAKINRLVTKFYPVIPGVNGAGTSKIKKPQSNTKRAKKELERSDIL